MDKVAHRKPPGVSPNIAIRHAPTAATDAIIIAISVLLVQISVVTFGPVLLSDLLVVADKRVLAILYNKIHDTSTHVQIAGIVPMAY